MAQRKRGLSSSMNSMERKQLGVEKARELGNALGSAVELMAGERESRHFRSHGSGLEGRGRGSDIEVHVWLHGRSALDCCVRRVLE